MRGVLLARETIKENASHLNVVMYRGARCGYVNAMTRGDQGI